MKPEKNQRYETWVKSLEENLNNSGIRWGAKYGTIDELEISSENQYLDLIKNWEFETGLPSPVDEDDIKKQIRTSINNYFELMMVWVRSGKKIEDF